MQEKRKCVCGGGRGTRIDGGYYPLMGGGVGIPPYWTALPPQVTIKKGAEECFQYQTPQPHQAVLEEINSTTPNHHMMQNIRQLSIK